MTNNNAERRALAERLLAAANPVKNLACSYVEEQLATLVEAELNGEDVYSNPVFRPLLEHIENCADCATLYDELTDEMLALEAVPVKQPTITLRRPIFFSPDRTERFADQVVEVWERTIRQLRLSLSPQAQLRKIGQSTTTPLFAQELIGVFNDPLLIITLKRVNEQFQLETAIRQPGSVKLWRVQLVIEDYMRELVTDQQGLAVFTELPNDSHLQELTITYVEETA